MADEKGDTFILVKLDGCGCVIALLLFLLLAVAVYNTLWR